MLDVSFECGKKNNRLQLYREMCNSDKDNQNQMDKIAQGDQIDHKKIVKPTKNG